MIHKQDTKNSRIGETAINSQGLTMEIIKYIDSKNIDVKFEDDTIVTKKYYRNFLIGNIKNHNYYKNIGETNHNNNNELMKIIHYTSAIDIIVEFQDENKTQVNCTYSNFKKGGVENPFQKTVLNIGYIGQGHYFPKTHNKIYKTWNSMLSRCYNQRYYLKEPTYKDCTVCEEWHCFQNFAKWYEENYYDVNNETINLDKDILVKGNKIYSPNTCVFVPENINKLFIKNQNKRGEYPIGVSASDNMYLARCSTIDKIKRVSLGYYSTPEDAFYLGYKPFKEKYIKKMADKYKYQIPQNLYDALYKYEVEITD